MPALIMAALLWSTAANAARLAVVGDSLSVGLASALTQLDQADQVVSWGVVGSGLLRKRPADWQARIEQVADTKPDLIVLLIGMNDTGTNPGPSYSNRLMEMLTPVRKLGIRVWLVGVPITTSQERNAHIVIMNKLIEGVSGGRWIAVPEFPRAERTADGIHFTPAGYRDLASIVLGCLAKGQ